MNRTYLSAGMTQNPMLAAATGIKGKYEEFKTR